jgi:hypothetical protein
MQSRLQGSLPAPVPSYHVSSSFRCCLQPKRASADIKLYLQLHKKMLRRAVIEQKFEENLYVFEHSHLQARKGFVGNSLHESPRRKSFTTQRENRVFTETSYPAMGYLRPRPEKVLTEPCDEWRHQKYQTTALRPKNTCNLTLYRKKSRRPDSKRELDFRGSCNRSTAKNVPASLFFDLKVVV